MAKLTEEQKEIARKLRETHGDIAVYQSPDGGLMVLAKPAHFHLIYEDMSQKTSGAVLRAVNSKDPQVAADAASTISIAQTQCVLDCLILPEEPEKKLEQLRKFPALRTTLFKRISKYAGEESEEITAF